MSKNTDNNRLSVIRKEISELDFAEKIRADFPQISDDYIYFDNAATSLKPRCVIDRIAKFYEQENANARRGLYDLSVNAEREIEATRKELAAFLDADDDYEIIFTKSATEAINLAALSWPKDLLRRGDMIAVSLFEHHSNMLPWQKLAKDSGLDFELFNPEDSELTFKPNTKIVAMTAASNVVGKMPRLKEIITAAHSIGALVVVDATQLIAHEKLSIAELDADFLVFSGHKIFAPFGVGVLCAKKSVIKYFEPAILGGEMVDSVDFENEKLSITLSKSPFCFEAGSPNTEAILGLRSAIDYLNGLDTQKLSRYRELLDEYMLLKLQHIQNIELVDFKTENRCGIFSFNLQNIHPHDVAEFLNQKNICVRAGYHCAQPLVQYLVGKPCVRASLSIYNTVDEIDAFCLALEDICEEMPLNE